MTRIEEIVQDRLKEDPKLQHLPTENLHQELMKDMERSVGVHSSAAIIMSAE